MAISDKDFYASHGISYDIEEMQIEYTRRVIKQAKIEVLIELQMEFEKIETGGDTWELAIKDDCKNLIQEKIDKLKEDKK